MEVIEKAKAYAALSDPIRLRLLKILKEKGLACGKELASDLGISGALVSHHAKILEDVGLIVRKKEGLYSRFSINEKTVQNLSNLIE